MAPGSLPFLFAFALAWPLYWWGRRSWRVPLLLVISYAALFAASWPTALAVVAMGLISWAGCRASNSTEGRRRHAVLSVCLALVFVVLVGATLLAPSNGVPRTIATSGALIAAMHSVSMLVDRYRAAQTGAVVTVGPAEALLFVGFFANVGVGPLTRRDKFDRALRKAPDRPVATEQSDAVEMAIMGAFKLLVVANALAPTVGTGYLADLSADVRTMGLPVLVLWSVVVRVFGYMALAGAVDLARAAAAALSLPLPREMRRPLTASTDLRDYWRRHHSTFMAWARDYVFKVFRGRGGLSGWSPLAVTFVLLSFLHGISLSWIANGLLMATAVWWESRRSAALKPGWLYRVGRTARVWLVLTAIAVLAFAGRAALTMASEPSRWLSFDGIGSIGTAVGIAVVSTAVVDWHAYEVERGRRTLSRDAIVAVAILLLLLWVGTSAVPEFAYRQ